MAETRTEQAREQETSRRTSQESGSSGRGQSSRQAEGTQQQSMMRRDRYTIDDDPFFFPFALSPFTLLRRFFGRDIAEMMGEVDRDRTWGNQTSSAPWTPRVDVMQQGSELIVRADLPGVNPDDVTVDVSEDGLTIAGERREERREERNGVYRMERSYGSFYRVVPLPDGAMTDQANATFKNGVLEIKMPAPPEQVSRGRRLQISRGDQASNESKNQAASQGDRP
jgi:HSP20 family protein